MAKIRLHSEATAAGICAASIVAVPGSFQTAFGTQIRTRLRIEPSSATGSTVLR